MKPFPMYVLTASEPEEQEFIKGLTLLDETLEEEQNPPIEIKLTVGDLYCAMQNRDLSWALLFASENFGKLIDSPANLEIFIRATHLYAAKYLVMLSLVETPSGEYRVDNLANGIGIPYQNIPQAMNEFCNTLFSKLQGIKIKEEAIEVGIFALTELCRIHPFSNGNGRTARILMNCVFMHFGNYDPITFPDTDEYNALFDEYIKGDSAPLKILILELLINAQPSSDLVTRPSDGVAFPHGMTIYFDKTQGIGVVKSGQGFTLDPPLLSELSTPFAENLPVYNFLTKLAKWDWVEQGMNDWKNLPSATAVALVRTTHHFFQNASPSTWKPYPALPKDRAGQDIRFFKFAEEKDAPKRDQFIAHLEQEGFSVVKTQLKTIPCIQVNLTFSKPKI